MFFRLGSLELGLILFGVVFGATALGLVLGRWYGTGRKSSGSRSECCRLHCSALSRSSSRSGSRWRSDATSSRRAAVVEDANAIGTTYLRAETLAEPFRTGSLERLGPLHGYQHPAFTLRAGERRRRGAIADGDVLQRELWGLAGQALADAPTASAPRLYVESLNEMIDMQTVRVAALNNRVPSAVLGGGGRRSCRPLPARLLPVAPRPRRDHRPPRRGSCQHCCSW